MTNMTTLFQAQMSTNKNSTFFDCKLVSVSCGPKNSFFGDWGCGRILITLVRPEPAEKSTQKGHGKRLLALVVPVD